VYNFVGECKRYNASYNLHRVQINFWWWCYLTPSESTEKFHRESGHAPRSGPEVKNGKSSAKDAEPERLR